MSDEIAQTTLSQLGGYGKLTSTIGAEYFTYKDNDLTFRFRGSDKSNLVSIKLNGYDTYDITFYKVGTKNNIKEVGKINDVYNDQLQDTFEEFTGLMLTLSNRDYETKEIREAREIREACPEGFEYVRPHNNSDGTHVRGFCRKIPEDRKMYFGFRSEREMLDYVREVREKRKKEMR